MIGVFSANSLSALVGLNPKIGMGVFSFTGLGVAYILVRQYSKRMEIKNALTPLVTRVVKRSAG
jgi:positive regulator of sigma E activity